MRTALVTGGASGIGAALVARLRHEGFEVESLDLANGLRRDRPGPLGRGRRPVDVACLNAGVLGGPADPTELTLDGYRRAIARQRRRRRPRRPPARDGDAARRPDRLHGVARGPDGVPDDPVYARDEARGRRVRPERRRRRSRRAGSRSTPSARGSPTRRWSRATARERLASRRLPAAERRRRRGGGVGRARRRARRATPGSSSRAGRRSTSASRRSRAPAGVTRRSACRPSFPDRERGEVRDSSTIRLRDRSLSTPTCAKSVPIDPHRVHVRQLPLW